MHRTPTIRLLRTIMASRIYYGLTGVLLHQREDGDRFLVSRIYLGDKLARFIDYPNISISLSTYFSILSKIPTIFLFITLTSSSFSSGDRSFFTMLAILSTSFLTMSKAFFMSRLIITDSLCDLARRNIVFLQKYNAPKITAIIKIIIRPLKAISSPNNEITGFSIKLTFTGSVGRLKAPLESLA